MRVIATPNLPQRPVRLAAVSASFPEVVAVLQQEGIEALKIRMADTLPPPVADHTDLQLLHLGGNRVLLAQEAAYIAPELSQYGFVSELIAEKLGDRYPKDISLNFLLHKNCCYGMCSIMPLQLSDYCNYAGIAKITSKQGYARCSVAVVTEQAAITADSTLYKLLSAHGLDCLLVGSGDIILEGYDTGFIGGCCGLIDKRRLAFTGTLEKYQYGNQVLEFLQRHGVQPVYLRNSKLLDIGGVVPLMENE